MGTGGSFKLTGQSNGKQLYFFWKLHILKYDIVQDLRNCKR